MKLILIFKGIDKASTTATLHATLSYNIHNRKDDGTSSHQGSQRLCRLQQDRLAIPPTALRATTTDPPNHHESARTQSPLRIDQPVHLCIRTVSVPGSNLPDRLRNQQELLPSRSMLELTPHGIQRPLRPLCPRGGPPDTETGYVARIQYRVECTSPRTIAVTTGADGSRHV
jgi:hypothetical protein